MLLRLTGLAGRTRLTLAGGAARAALGCATAGHRRRMDAFVLAPTAEDALTSFSGPASADGATVALLP